MTPLNIPIKKGADAPRLVRPARGTCRVILEINGVNYVARPIPSRAIDVGRLVRLRKADGAVYYVSEHEHGTECDCPDFIFHRDGVDPGGCKHIKALVACGLLANDGEREDETAHLPPRASWVGKAREAFELEQDYLSFGPRTPARAGRRA